MRGFFEPSYKGFPQPAFRELIALFVQAKESCKTYNDEYKTKDLRKIVLAMASFQKMPRRLCLEDIRDMKISFSQHGEDLLLMDHLVPYRKNSKKGIYIDAGCYDPFLFSNTRLLNLHGWTGINVDAAKDVIHKYRKHRPLDHNVCTALSDQVEERQFVGETGMASRRLLGKEEDNAFDVKNTETVRTLTLAAVLDASPFQNDPVDVLDIDCELNDLAVLRGFPFQKTRPFIICIEAHTADEAGACRQVLDEIGYMKIATRGPTHIYRDKASVPSGLPWYARVSEL